MSNVHQQSIRLPNGRVVPLRDDQARYMISADFSPQKAYLIQDLVIYEDCLYQFTNYHPAGEWTGTDVQEVNLDDAMLKTADVELIIANNVATPEDIEHIFE